MSQIISWGYEGKTIEDLISFASSEDVQAVVDVRLTPISRKKGFSKTRLSRALESAGIRYLHSRALGNPKDNRLGFAFPGSPEAALAHSRFTTEVLSTPDAQVAIHEIADLASNGNVLVLCYESEHSQCHRKLVIEAAQKELKS